MSAADKIARPDRLRWRNRDADGGVFYLGRPSRQQSLGSLPHQKLLRSRINWQQSPSVDFSIRGLPVGRGTVRLEWVAGGCQPVLNI
jgi:hypothetical protein